MSVQIISRPSSLATSPRDTRALRLTLSAALLALLAACGGSPTKPHRVMNTGWSTQAATSVPPDAANDVLFRAIGLVGTPYHWGGNTPEGGFDCSGLVNYIYLTSTGVRLPRTSQEMAGMNKPKLDAGQLVSGDLVFFGRRGSISHVGVYVGKGRFVHAPNSGGTVRLDNLDGSYWRDNFAYGKRVLN
jgi:cell wall-associated NlpC family hydrolase